MIDAYNKHLFEIEKHSIRKVREKLDSMAKDLVNPDPQQIEKTLFDIRQFFSSYRIDEYSYIQNTFDDFKRIVWDFADQLSEDLSFENSKEKHLATNLKDLKDAVEANSIEILRHKSREFINSYVEYQSQKNELRNKRIVNTKKNLNLVKKQLLDANNSLNIDHLTGASNRKNSDEYIKKLVQMNKISNGQISIIMLDIDFFKKINDTYGHERGDELLCSFADCYKQSLGSETMLYRLGGDEFAALSHKGDLPKIASALEEALGAMKAIGFEFAGASAGSVYGYEAENIASLMRMADARMYENKRSRKSHREEIQEQFKFN